MNFKFHRLITFLETVCFKGEFCEYFGIVITATQKFELWNQNYKNKMQFSISLSIEWCILLENIRMPSFNILDSRYVPRFSRYNFTPQNKKF